MLTQTEQVSVHEIVSSGRPDEVKQFFSPQTHMVQLVTASGGGNGGMFTFTGEDSTGIGANSCAKISFKYHHSNGGGGDGMNCGLVVKQNDDYFVQFFGVTGQASTIVKTMEKQLDVDSWLRVGGTGTTYYPNFDKPCSYGLIFANTSVSVVAYITDIKICLKHSCKVSDTVCITYRRRCGAICVSCFQR